MSLEKRIALIRKIEALRGSTVMAFLTGLRPGVIGNIADDSVRVFFDHLLKLPRRPVAKLDIFLCSNGGSGTVPWRLVSLFREFAKSFNVLIPYRAYSAASLLALGADEIVMHPFAELGPIDPTVSNDFNPTDPRTSQRIGISVEDVTAYVNFIKSTVGITHEDELVQAVKILVEKVHPLALGNVERFLSQSRMIAKKILNTHTQTQDEHVIDEIVENMASKLYFHGHPINRKEAKNELKLKVNDELDAQLENAMWQLYLLYEGEFQNTVSFNPAGDLAKVALDQMEAWRKQVQGANTANPPSPPPSEAVVQYDLLHAMVESSRVSSQMETTRRYTLTGQLQPGQPPMIREDILKQGWSHSLVPAAPRQSVRRRSTSAGGAPKAGGNVSGARE